MRRLRLRPWLAGAGIAFAIVAVAGVASGLVAGAKLIQGQRSLELARSALGDGDLTSAQAGFEEAAQAFSEAYGGPQGMVLHVIGLVPWVGNSADALVGLGSAGDDLAAAGTQMLESVNQMPGGTDALAPAGSSIPIRLLQQIAPAAEAARNRIDHAQETLDALPRSFLLGPSGSAIQDAREALYQGAPAIRSLAAAMSALPSFLGADGPRTYIVAAQNPAELRGTGGLIGEWATMRTDRGRVQLGRFHNISQLPYPGKGARKIRELDRTTVYQPSDVSETGIPSFFGQKPLVVPSYTNVAPRAADSGPLLQAAVERGAGIRSDGVIFVSPQALPYLLRASGPVESRDLETVLTPENAVRYTTNEAYRDFDLSSERKEALGSAASEVWEAFLRAPRGEAKVRALVEAATAGTILLTSDDPAEQQQLETAGVGGLWGPPNDSTDFLATALNNFAGNKVDFYLRPKADYDIELLADGSARTTATLTLTNGAPEGQDPSYVLGPFEGNRFNGGLEAGDTTLGIAQYCGQGCDFEGATVNDRPEGAQVEPDGDVVLMGKYVGLEADSTKVVTFSTLVPDAWHIEHGRGVYDLRIQVPPTITPFEVSAHVVVPDGTTVLQVLAPRGREDASDSTATSAEWSTDELHRWADLQVTFDKGFVGKFLDQL